MLITDRNGNGLITVALHSLLELHKTVFGSEGEVLDNNLCFLKTPGRVVAIVPGLIGQPDSSMDDQVRQAYQGLYNDFASTCEMFCQWQIVLEGRNCDAMYLVNGGNFSQRMEGVLGRAFFERATINSAEHLFSWFDSSLLAVTAHEVRHEWQTLYPNHPLRTFASLSGDLLVEAEELKKLREAEVMPPDELTKLREDDALVTELLVHSTMLEYKKPLKERFQKAVQFVKS